MISRCYVQTTCASERFSVFTKSWLTMSDGMALIAFLGIKPGPQFRTAMSRLSSSHNRRNVLLLGRPKNMPRTGLNERSMTRDDIFAFGHSLRGFIALGYTLSSPLRRHHTSLDIHCNTHGTLPLALALVSWS